MKIGIAKHIKSGAQVEFVRYAKGNYENTLNWYERDATSKANYGREEIINGDGFSYLTQDGRREYLNNDFYLVRFGLGDFYDVSPRDFKEWYEVTKDGAL